MQVSAINLIIAAQQARDATAPRTASQTKAPATGNSAAPSSDFAPLSFGSRAAPAQPAAAPAVYSANAPLGSQIDIRA